MKEGEKKESRIKGNEGGERKKKAGYRNMKERG